MLAFGVQMPVRSDVVAGLCEYLSIGLREPLVESSSLLIPSVDMRAAGCVRPSEAPVIGSCCEGPVRMTVPLLIASGGESGEMR